MDLKTQEVETMRPSHRGGTSTSLSLLVNMSGKDQQLQAVREERLGLILMTPCVDSLSLFVHQTKPESLNDLAWHLRDGNTRWNVDSGVTALLSTAYKEATYKLPKDDIQFDLSRAELMSVLSDLLTRPSAVPGRRGIARIRPVLFDFVTEVTFTEEVLQLVSDVQLSHSPPPTSNLRFATKPLYYVGKCQKCGDRYSITSPAIKTTTQC